MIDISKLKISKNIIIPENFTHALCVGETGSGKTTSFIYPNLLNRMQKRHGILIYDYKGNEHLNIKYLAKYSKRLMDVIEIGKPWGKKINFIQNMNLSEIRRVLTSLIPNNDFSSSAAINLGINLIQVLRLYRELDNSLYKTFKENYRNDIYNYKYKDIYNIHIDTSEKEKIYVIPIEKDISLSTVYNIVNIPFNMQVFSRRIEVIYLKLKKIQERNGLTDPYINLLLIEIEKSIKTLKQYQNIEELEELKKVLFILENSLSRIGNNEIFNENETDIVERLNKGRIIIIDTESLEKNLLSILNESIFNSLISRVKKEQKRLVTIFIDELQRVLDKEIISLPIDVFREAKVDVIVSFQNQQQIITKIGQGRYESLATNFTKKIFFRTSNKIDIEDSQKDLKKLNTFEYVHFNYENSIVEKTDPLFINKEDAYKIEEEFQNINKIFEFYSLKTMENTILFHEQRIFEISQSAYLYNYKERKYYLINLLDDRVKNILLQKIDTNLYLDEKYF